MPPLWFAQNVTRQIKAQSDSIFFLHFRKKYYYLDPIQKPFTTIHSERLILWLAGKAHWFGVCFTLSVAANLFIFLFFDLLGFSHEPRNE